MKSFAIVLASLIAGVASQHGECVVCGYGKEITIEDAIFKFPSQPPVTCDLLQSAGMMGLIPAASCPFLPDMVSTICGCSPSVDDHAPTDPPITIAPIAASVAPAPEEPVPVVPTTPTVSSHPSAESDDVVTVLLVLTLDNFAWEIGWRIETAAANDILYEVEAGTYGGLYGIEITEQVDLPRKINEYRLVLVDKYGDGLDTPAFLYLGDAEDAGNVLAHYHSGGENNFTHEWSTPFQLDQPIVGVFPTQSPSAPSVAPSAWPSAPTASPGPTDGSVQCLFVIYTDYFPRETGWILTSTHDGVVVHQVVAGEYETDFTTYNTTITLQEGAAYQLLLTDDYGDGLFGSFFIFYGEEADMDKVLLRYDPPKDDFFSHELTLNFVVSELGTIKN